MTLKLFGFLLRNRGVDPPVLVVVSRSAAILVVAQVGFPAVLVSPVTLPQLPRKLAVQACTDRF